MANQGDPGSDADGLDHQPRRRRRLVAVRPNGQQRLYVGPEGLDALRDFLAEFWPAQLQRLKHVVEAETHDR